MSEKENSALHQDMRQLGDDELAVAHGGGIFPSVPHTSGGHLTEAERLERRLVARLERAIDRLL